MAKDKNNTVRRRPGVAGIVIGIILMVCGPVAGGVLAYSTTKTTPYAGFTTWIIAAIVVATVVFLVGLVLLIAMVIGRYGWHENPKPTPARRQLVPETGTRRAGNPPQTTSSGFLRPTLAIEADPPSVADPPATTVILPQAGPPPQVWPPTYVADPPEDWNLRSPYGNESSYG